MAARAPDPYQVLGVSRSASDEEVRSAYRRLAQLHHPDHNGGSREAAAAYKRPSDEELGYVHTDDTFGKVLADARQELSERLSEARQQPIGKTVSELIDELAAKLSGGRPDDAD